MRRKILFLNAGVNYREFGVRPWQESFAGIFPLFRSGHSGAIIMQSGGGGRKGGWGCVLWSSLENTRGGGERAWSLAHASFREVSLPLLPSLPRCCSNSIKILGRSSRRNPALHQLKKSTFVARGGRKETTHSQKLEFGR